MLTSIFEAIINSLTQIRQQILDADLADRIKRFVEELLR